MDIYTRGCGGAGLQYGLPGTWEGLRKRGAAPEALTKLWSTFPAQLAGLEGKKGALKAGLDADIVVRCDAIHSVTPFQSVTPFPATWR